MKKIIISTLVAVLTLLPTLMYAQNRTVTGKVLDG